MSVSNLSIYLLQYIRLVAMRWLSSSLSSQVSAPNTDLHFLAEPQIKYESPYSAEPPQYDPNQSPLKRRYSETVHNAQESDEKRQRIEVEQSFADDMDFAAMIAQAAATAAREVTAAVPNFSNHDPVHPVEDSFQTHEEPDYSAAQSAGISSGFSSDPHLYMRILSLPILESLVSDVLLMIC